MKRIILPFVIACYCAVAAFGQATYCDKVIGGYVPWWYSANQYSGINYNELTHAYFAFIGSKEDGSLCAYKWEGSTVKTIEFEGNTEVTAAFDIFKQKATAARTKKIISIGGAGSDPYLQLMAKNAANRAKFVTNLWDFVNRHQLDGVDMDWEALENENHKTWYHDLLKDIQTAKPAGKIVVATVMATNNFGQWFPTDVVNACDLVQLMAYDNTATWANSPAGNHSTLIHATAAIAYWKEKGTPDNKLVLGVPFYGYQQKNDVTNGNGLSTKTWTYKDIIAIHNPGPDADDIKLADVPETIFFNGITTIKKKVDLGYALRGVMAWELTQDVPYTDSKSLHRAIIEQFKVKCPDGHGNTTGIKENKIAVANSYYNAQLNQIRVNTAVQGRVNVSLYNVLGQEVFTKSLGTLGIGEYGVTLEKEGLKAGIYIVTVSVNNERASSKIFID